MNDSATVATTSPRLYCFSLRQMRKPRNLGEVALRLANDLNGSKLSLAREKP